MTYQLAAPCLVELSETGKVRRVVPLKFYAVVPATEGGDHMAATALRTYGIDDGTIERINDHLIQSIIAENRRRVAARASKRARRRLADILKVPA